MVLGLIIILLLLLLPPLGDCWGIDNDRRDEAVSPLIAPAPPPVFNDVGVDGVVVVSSAAFVFGANDTLLLVVGEFIAVEEVVLSSCSL